MNRWTQEETSFLQKNAKLGYKEIAQRLGKSYVAVKTKAQRINVKVNRLWTEEEVNYIKENIGKKLQKEIAADLHRDFSSLTIKVLRLGLSKRVAYWSEQEIRFLEEKYGKLSNEKIGKKLGRTARAVKVMAHRLNLGPKNSANGMISLVTLYTIIYPNRHAGIKMAKEFIDNGLKVYPYKLSTHNPKRITYMVNMDEFWKWAEEHKEAVKFARLEENALGLEPKWVKEKRKQEWLEHSNKRWAGKV